MSTENGARITGKDLLDRIDRLEERITKDFNAKFADHEARIRKEEQNSAKILTIAGVISLGMSLFAAEIKSRIFGS